MDISTKLGNLQRDLVNAMEAKQLVLDSNMAGVDGKDERMGDSLAEIRLMLRDLQSMTRIIPVQHRILRQLIYDDMRSRRAQIYSAESETCRWIIEHEVERRVGSSSEEDKRESRENPDRREARRVFRSWLREGQNVFHISGNAGSGKSTLMKFIAGQDGTKEELQVWAGTKALVMAEFYFWNSGTRLQRTLPGLYRSLLFEVLSHCPELIEVVFPRQWKRFNAGPGDRVVESMSFGDSDVEEAFAVLLEKKQHTGHRFCFFIDGLDEYPGNDLAREDLALKLSGWTDGGDIKICVSSRPNQEFDLLCSGRGGPKIHLHRLNQPDIYTYCLNRFKKDRAVQEAEETYVDLMDEIVKNAKGVFLWAYLVVDILLEAVRRGASHEVLKKKLNEIPPELDALYTNLRESVGKSEIDRLISNKILFLVANNPFNRPLNAVVLSWLDGPDNLEDPSFPSTTDPKPYSGEEITRREERVRKQVGGLTKGLLEVGTSFSVYDLDFLSFLRLKVRFFHRTARDYLLHNAERLKALQCSFSGLEQVDLYGRIRLAEYLLVPKLGQLASFSHELMADFKELRAISPRLSLDIIRKFQIVTRRLGSFYQIQRSMNTTGSFIGPEGAWGSFLHLAAYEGLDEFVLDEIASNPRLDHTTEGLSLLLTALASARWTLASTLLDLGIGLDKMCPLEQGAALTGHKSILWPVWVLASSLLVQLFKSHGILEKSSTQFSILQRLVQHGASRGNTFSLSFTFKSLPEDPPEERQELKINDMQIGDLILFFESYLQRLEEPEIAALPIGPSNVYDLAFWYKKERKYMMFRVCWGTSYFDFQNGFGYGPTSERPETCYIRIC